MEEQLNTIKEDLDSKIANIIDNLEEMISSYDIGDSEETMEEAQDYIDKLEEIRGDINA